MAFTTKTLIRGTEIDVAPLEIISFKKLVEKNEDECARLYKAAQSPGFFLLDVKDLKKHVADIQQVYALTEQYFSQPEEAKLEDFRPGDEFRGYKDYKGANVSTFEVLRDEVDQTASLPKAFQPDTGIISRFVSDSQNLVTTIAARLSELLWPGSHNCLESHYRPAEPSKTSLKVIRGPMLEKVADVGDNTHTDGGILTLMYCDKWTTQIELPGSEIWAWVNPLPEHAIVNVGDALQVLSGGRLRSCKHRVSQVGDGAEERWAITYFLRPADGVNPAVI
ncbi:hypothetical protein TWF569_007227 [Orbilia oligospora]|uniref:Uncharacterized protein n=1 Tax=Orbilia oligospora TaxID=2813651 RepID=A0A7C8PJL7_ORBOL|nr:hypothetical protein TWF569_007227 [Orbilia oligospora]KAF3167132.1 hypothetical protein TWF225_012055 [Orbilia oligospora]KAF3174841.1 hypothetical protein TWF751_004595 [Orbilia oligospora]KAF3236485.1 hypothetical protein TWF128_001351 [Orbilia oligospora]KAF3266140.1 hypothetical protein TWF217_001822 [Orbilia oligospora]